jgi:hypothetical protein
VEQGYHNYRRSKHPSNVQRTSTRTSVLQDALEQAEQGRGVFPLRGKVPLTERGFYDATTDRARVTAMFNQGGRNATGYGIRCGQASRIVVVDVDGPEARAEAERRGLRSGYVVKTGRPEGDGWHVYLSIPGGVELKSRDIAPGLELKAERCYVVGPGSLHPEGGMYRVVKNGEPSPAPEWVLAADRDRGDHDHHLDHHQRGRVSIDTAGPPIHEGERNKELARIAGRLHDGTRDLGQLEADLLAVNEARCKPPLDVREVRRIAASIHQRLPCKPCTAAPEVLDALESVEARLWARDWPGMAGKSARDMFVAMLRITRRHGELDKDGIRAVASVRQLALAAAISKPTAINARRYLEAEGLARFETARGTKAGAFVLLFGEARRANFNHSSTEYGCRGKETPIEERDPSGKELRAAYSAPRLRWSAPRFDRIGDEIVRTTLTRLGKGCGYLLDALERRNGSATIAELAADMGIARPRDAYRRYVSRLVGANVVTVSGDTVTLTELWLDALEKDRERGEEVAAYRRDMARYGREGETLREDLADFRRWLETTQEPIPDNWGAFMWWRKRVKPERAPTEREMRRRRESYPDHRREAIKDAIGRLFSERPEYRSRRAGQIVCALAMGYIGPDFPRGAAGVPKDAEVESILDGVAA